MRSVVLVAALVVCQVIANFAGTANGACTACAPCTCSTESDGSVWYECSGTGLTIIPTCFSPSTVSISLMDNYISVIPDNAFANLPKLQNLLLTNNFLDTIHLEAFANTNIEILELSSNLFDHVPELALYPIQHSLGSFYFDNNFVTTVPVLLFAGFDQLGSVSLSKNSLDLVKSWDFGATIFETATLWLDGQYSRNITISNDAFVDFTSTYWCGAYGSFESCQMDACRKACPGDGLSCFTTALTPDAKFACIPTLTSADVHCRPLNPANPNTFQCGASSYDISSFGTKDSSVLTYSETGSGFAYFLQLAGSGMAGSTPSVHGNCTLPGSGALATQLDLSNNTCVHFAMAQRAKWTLDSSDVLTAKFYGGKARRNATVKIACDPTAVEATIDAVEYDNEANTLLFATSHCSACKAGCPTD